MNPISDYLISKSNHNEYEATFGQAEDVVNNRVVNVRTLSVLGSLVATVTVFMQIFA